MKYLFSILLISFLYSCSVLKTPADDDLYYQPNFTPDIKIINTEQDSLINTYYNFNTYNNYYPIYSYQYYDPFFSPFWIEDYYWYSGYFNYYSPSSIYFTLRTYGFPINFSRYYSYNYWYYNNWYYNFYRKQNTVYQHRGTYNSNTNINHKRLPRKDNPTYKYKIKRDYKRNDIIYHDYHKPVRSISNNPTYHKEKIYQPRNNYNHSTTPKSIPSNRKPRKPIYEQK